MTDFPGLFSAVSAEVDGPLEDWGLRPGADSGEPRMSGRILFTTADGSVEVGIWACTPGGWSIEDRPDTETVRILSGRARLTDAGAGEGGVGARTRRRARPPQGLVRPLGHPRAGPEALRPGALSSVPLIG